MSLCGQEQSEILMWFHREHFLLQNTDEVDDKMQIFKAEPFALPGSLFKQLKSIVILIPSHRQLLKLLLPDYLCGKLLNFFGRVETDAHNEQTRDRIFHFLFSYQLHIDLQP